MAIMQVFRETAVPAVLEPYSIYYIANPATPNHVEVYVTDATGTGQRRVPTVADIDSQIAAALSNVGGGTAVVADITARNALSPGMGSMALVLDASADSTVTAGSATYVYDGSAWVKISEHESMDVSLTWAALTGKPTSTPTNIDLAVTNSHTHTNKTQLDQIGQDVDGNLTYGGLLPKAPWATTGW